MKHLKQKINKYQKLVRKLTETSRAQEKELKLTKKLIKQSKDQIGQLKLQMAREGQLFETLSAEAGKASAKRQKDILALRGALHTVRNTCSPEHQALIQKVLTQTDWRKKS